MTNRLFYRYKTQHTPESRDEVLIHVRQLALSYLNDEDAAQQVTLTVLAKLDTVDVNKTFKDWLKGVIWYHKLKSISQRVSDHRCQPLPDEFSYDHIDYTPELPDLSKCEPIDQRLCQLILMDYSIKQAAAMVGLKPREAHVRLKKLGEDCKSRTLIAS